MTIDLSNLESGHKYDGNYNDDLAAVQERLARIQYAHIVHGARSLLVFEGWDAAGKGGLIKRLTAELDPRFFEVIPVAAPAGQEKEEHYLTRFWANLPLTGDWSIFDRTWYGRVLVERVEGYASAEEWGRAYAEINAIEAMQAAHGTRIVKLFLHTSQEEQDERLMERLKLPWKRWKVGPDDFRNRRKREAYLQAYEDMFARTDTPHARWHIIGANHKKQARLEGLRIIADCLADGVDLTDPPLDPELRKLAEKELGVTLKPQ